MAADTHVNASAKRASVRRLGPWFHNLHLPDGRQTAPRHPYGDFPAVKWKQIEPFIPARLDGWRAIDIGCNAGFYSFELARRGAHVTAIDIDPRYLRQARWAAREYGLQDRIDFQQTSLYTFGRRGERFDLVWFLGVLYHLRHPLLALDLLRGMTQRLLVLQTMTMPGGGNRELPRDISLDERNRMQQQGWPRMAFIEHRLEKDPTNWWAPDHACVEAMARTAGFMVSARPGPEIFVCKPNRRESRVAASLREAELRALLDPL